jgi:hypothetical protein
VVSEEVRTPCGGKGPPRVKRRRKVAPCGVCGHTMRSDKLKQHLLSHSRQKGRDSRGRYFSQDGVAPDGGSSLSSFTPCGGSVSGSAPCGGSVGRVTPCGGSPIKRQKNDIEENTTLEDKRAAVRALA